MKKLNIGCGSTFHPSWTNIDLNPPDPRVGKFNFLSGLPYPSNHFDVVYHSHVLEHLDRKEAEKFLTDCFRILKPGGTLRVVVPDLEQIVRLYLTKLQDTLANRSKSLEYDWILLELFDQMARGKPGGEMATMLEYLPETLRPFVESRIGVEGQGSDLKTRRSFRYSLSRIFFQIHKGWGQFLVFLFGGKKWLAAFNEGLFRKSGEIHKIMYDRYSLPSLLERNGFKGISIVSAFESSIEDFEKDQLDTLDDKVRKPDSLFVECQK